MTLTGRELRAARDRAPKHPPGPEAHLRLAVVKLLRAHHAAVKEAVLRVAAPMRRDEDTSKLDAPTLALLAATLADYGTRLLHRSPFAFLVAGIAKRTARSANEQTAKAMKGFDPEFDEEAFDPEIDTDEWQASVLDGMGAFLSDGVERGAAALSAWAALGAEDDGYGDVDALGDSVDASLGGVMGAALAWAAMKFGALFGDVVQASQREAGIASATWLTMLDSHVRPSHRALDGVVFTWDEPPLKAAVSSLGIDCFPGDDANCRCVASPSEPG